MLVAAAASFAFTGPVTTKVTQSRAAVSMGMDRRNFLQTAAGAAVLGLPLAAQVWILPACLSCWVVGSLGRTQSSQRAS